MAPDGDVMSFSDETPKWSDLCRVHGFQMLPPHRQTAIIVAQFEQVRLVAVAREVAELAAMWGLEC